MAERLRKAAAWLGLVTDDRYHDEEVTEDVDLDEYTEEVDRRDRDSQAHDDAAEDRERRHRGEEASVTALETRRRGDRRRDDAGSRIPVSAGSEALQPMAVQEAQPMESYQPQTTGSTDLSRIITVHPRTYNEARAIGEHFRDGVPVIMNLSEMDDPDAKRLVDFAAGLIFGLRGSIERVTSRVFLLSPPGVNVTAEDKQRIAGEFFNQS